MKLSRLVILLGFAASSVAQTVTGSGTANYFAKWNAPSNLTTSALCQSASGGLVGVATCFPTQRLQVNSGNVLVRGINNFGAAFQTANYYVGDLNHAMGAMNGVGLYFNTNKHLNALTIQDVSGHVGVNNQSPNAQLAINGDCNGPSIMLTRQINDDIRLTADCNGNLAVNSLNAPSITFADGTVQTTAYNPATTATTLVSVQQKQQAQIRLMMDTIQQLKARVAQLEMQRR